MSAPPRLVEVSRKVLKQADLLARSLRGRFCEADVYAASLVSSPGSGKIMFVQEAEIDPAQAVEFDSAAANKNTQSLRPGMQVFEASAKAGAGFEPFLQFLESRLTELRCGSRGGRAAHS